MVKYKILFSFLILSISFSLYSQNLIQIDETQELDNTNLFVDVEIPEDSIPSINVENVNLQRTAIDTIDSKDKFIKIVLYDNHSWDYLDLHKPVVSEEVLRAYWDTKKIHPYKELSLKSFPEEIYITLVDSTCGFCPPHINKVGSSYCFRGKREHNGVDLSLTTGDTIRTAFDGIVRIAMASKYTGGYGNLVVVRHSNGLETYYGHLSKILVDTAEYVKAGEPIGLGGSSGRSTGAHLHFETRYNGQSFDPERIIDFKNGTLKDSRIVLKKHYFSIYSNHKQTDAQSLAASQRIVHTIKSGDTLTALASRYGTTVDKICKLNNISKNTTLKIGNKLVVR